MRSHYECGRQQYKEHDYRGDGARVQSAQTKPSVSIPPLGSRGLWGLMGKKKPLPEKAGRGENLKSIMQNSYYRSANAVVWFFTSRVETMS